MANEFQLQDSSGETVYGILTAAAGPNVGMVWNGSALVAPTYAGLSTFALPMSVLGNGKIPSTSIYSLSFPTALTAGGYFVLSPRVQAGSSPAWSDNLPTDNAANALTVQANTAGAVIPLFGGGVQMYAPLVWALASDLYQEYGMNNVVQWSALDGTKTENTSREIYMLTRACQFIRTFFSTGRSEVLSSINDMTNVVRWTAIVAGAMLYSARGAELDPRILSGGLFGAQGQGKLSTMEFGRFQGRVNLVLAEMGEYRGAYVMAQGAMPHGARYGSGDPPIYDTGAIVSGPYGV